MVNCCRRDSIDLTYSKLVGESPRESAWQGRCVTAGSILVPMTMIAMVVSAAYALFAGIHEEQEGEEMSAPFLFSTITVITGVLFASIFTELKNCRERNFKGNMMPTPTMVVLAFSVTGVVMNGISTFRADREIDAYQANQSAIQSAVIDRSYDCEYDVQGRLSEFTQAPCTVCLNGNAQWMAETLDEPVQQVFVDYNVNQMICNPTFFGNETLPVSWFKNILINESLFNDWPCNMDFLFDSSPFAKTVHYLGTHQNLNPPEDLTVTILNESCITVAGFAARRLSLPQLCRFDSATIFPYDLAMPCQNNYSVTYFNAFREEIAKIRNATLPYPNVTNAQINYWTMITLIGTGITSLVGEGVLHKKHRELQVRL